MAERPRLDDEACVGCAASPLEISLVLACDHRLCIACAAVQVRWPPSRDPTATCPRCGSTTEVDVSAARHICEVAPAVAQRRLDASSPSSSAAPGRRAAPRSGASTPRGGASTAAPSTAATAAGLQTPLGTPATAVRVGGPLPLCGQCQAFPAELDCQQCQEQFCADCSAAMHRAGRMRGHVLLPLGGAPRPATPGAPAFGAGGAPTLRCAAHPEEALQFFCFDCETEPICAECVVHHGARHHGHRVMKLSEAFQRLAEEEIPRMEQVGRKRAEDRAHACQRADGLRRDLTTTISQGRQRIKDAFVRLRSSLHQKEAQLLAGLEESAQAADGLVGERLAVVEERAGEIWATHVSLSKFDTKGDEVKSLNSYAAARVLMREFLEPLPGVDDGGLAALLDGLQRQLRETMAEQAGAVADFTSRAPEIRRAGSAGAGVSVRGDPGEVRR